MKAPGFFRARGDVSASIAERSPYRHFPANEKARRLLAVLEGGDEPQRHVGGLTQFVAGPIPALRAAGHSSGVMVQGCFHSSPLGDHQHHFPALAADTLATTAITRPKTIRAI